MLHKRVNDVLLGEILLKEQGLRQGVHRGRKRTDERHAGEVVVQGIEIEFVWAECLDFLHEISDASGKGLKRHTSVLCIFLLAAELNYFGLGPAGKLRMDHWSPG